MKKAKRVTLYIILVLLICVGRFSSAYFSVGDKQDEFITFKSGECLSITITEESDSINLTNIKPTTIEEGLNYEPYTFTIENNCAETTPYQISLESLNKNDNSLSVDYIYSSLEDSEGAKITNILGDFDETIITLENAYDARKLINSELEGYSTRSYKLRLWLDYDATADVAASKTHTSKIIIAARDRLELDSELITISFEGEQLSENEWVQEYKTKVIITSLLNNELTAKYCVSSNKCEPNTSVDLENNAFTYDYQNGSSILCVQASDKQGNSSKITCNNVVNVDNINPTINYTIAESKIGTNNWYHQLSLQVETVDNESGTDSFKYCVTSEATCTPTEVVNEKSIKISLNSGSESRKICASTTDNNGNDSDVYCSSSYNVDGTTPTVSITSISATTDSITTTINATDADSKIASFYYKIGSGSYTSSTSTTKLFAGLNAGTNYTIYVYAVDNAGNESEIASESITTLSHTCEIGTLTEGTTYGTICVAKASTEGWVTSSNYDCGCSYVECNCTTTQSCKEVSDGTCANACYADCETGTDTTEWEACYASCSESCKTTKCEDVETCSSCYVCTDVCTTTTYYCPSGWSEYSGSGSNLYCYTSPTT